MPFHVVELRVDAAEQPLERIAWPGSYELLEEAEAAAKAAAALKEAYGECGYNTEQGYWWARGHDGSTHRVFVEPDHASGPSGDGHEAGPGEQAP